MLEKNQSKERGIAVVVTVGSVSKLLYGHTLFLDLNIIEAQVWETAHYLLDENFLFQNIIYVRYLGGY